MNKEKICQNCKYHYIEEITFDYPQSCCAREKTHPTEKWCTCDKFEGNKEYFNNLEKYITKLELERDKYKKILDKIKEYAEENKIIGVIAREENEYMTHILKLLEEIE